MLYVGCEGEFAVPARVEAFRREKIQGPIDPEQFKLILTCLNLVAEVEQLIGDIEAIAKAGKVPPACDDIPASTPCVSEAIWRGYCYAGQIAQSDKPDAKRQAFNRSAKDLLGRGLVGKWNDLVWICPQRDVTGKRDT